MIEMQACGDIFCQQNCPARLYKNAEAFLIFAKTEKGRKNFLPFPHFHIFYVIMFSQNHDTENLVYQYWKINHVKNNCDWKSRRRKKRVCTKDRKSVV